MRCGAALAGKFGVEGVPMRGEDVLLDFFERSVLRCFVRRWRAASRAGTTTECRAVSWSWDVGCDFDGVGGCCCD